MKQADITITLAEEEFIAEHPIWKTCNKCGRSFPQTKQYFYFRKDKNLFVHPCKECRGQTFKILPREGYKFCSTCKSELPKTEEYFRLVHPKDHKNGYLCSVCRSCRKEYAKKYSEENADRLKMLGKIYVREHRKEISAKQKERYHKNPEAFRERMRKWAKKNPGKNHEYYENNKQYYKDYWAARKEEKSAYQKEYFKNRPNYHRNWYAANKERMKSKNKERYESKKEYYKEYYKKYYQTRKENKENSCI